MLLPPLVHLDSEDAYYERFVAIYCSGNSIITWDGLPVVFYPEMFTHAFYKRKSRSWKAKKDSFDVSRGERVDWIKAVLEDPSIVPYQGYNKATGTYDGSRRVAFLTPENYLVVIREDGEKWRFVTAYVVDNPSTASKILSSPIWKRAQKKTTGLPAQ